MLRKGLFSFFLFTFCGVTILAQQAEWRDLIEKKQFEKVILQVADLQPADSADFTKMYLIGQAYEGLLRYKEAYNCYKQCYMLDSSRIDMLNTLARIAVALGKSMEAEKYYRMVLETDSTNFYANFQLARLYVSLERYAEGFEHYNYLLLTDPENVTILWAKGDIYTRMGADALTFALANYLEANRLNVENATLANVTINTMLKMDAGNADYALAICDTALFYNPGHKALRQSKAMIYYLKKEYVKADSMYSSLMAEQDSSYNTLKYGGCARFHSRKWYDAIEPLEKAFEKDESAYDVCIFLGICIGRAYDPVQALEYFEIANTLMQPDTLWSNMLTGFQGEMYLKTGNINKAAEIYYQIWLKDKQKLNLIQQIHRSYGAQNVSTMSDDDRERYLFITFLYISELLERREYDADLQKSYFVYLRSVLKKFEEEMFMRGVTSLPMRSPDNKRNTLSSEKLKELISKLSE